MILTQYLFDVAVVIALVYVINQLRDINACFDRRAFPPPSNKDVYDAIKREVDWHVSKHHLP